MSQRQFWFLFVVVIILLVFCFANAQRAHADMMMGGVGKLMSPNASGGTVPGGGFAILTEAGDNLATEAGDILVLESAP